MNDTDEIARLRALWCEEKSKAMTFHAEVERLRAEVARLTAENARLSADFVDRDIKAQVLASISIVLSQRTADLAQRTAEVAKANAERDALQLRWQRLYGEIDCRIEHGASSNGHLEAVRKMMREVQP
jgi:ubiquinone biosynthesis protein UbiJ